MNKINQTYKLNNLYLVQIELNDVKNLSDILFYGDCYQNEMCFAEKLNEDSFRILSTNQTLSTHKTNNLPCVLKRSIYKCKDNGKSYSLAKLIHKEVLINLGIIKLKDIAENQICHNDTENLEK